MFWCVTRGLPKGGRLLPGDRSNPEADEAFITSSAGGIMPVNSVDGIVLGGVDGPGPIATRLHNLYWEKLWDGWKCSPVDYDGAA